LYATDENGAKALKELYSPYDPSVAVRELLKRLSSEIYSKDVLNLLYILNVVEIVKYLLGGYVE
jgi:hypothetical protein